MRWGYIFSEYISPNAGIETIPGIHVPAPEEPTFDEEMVFFLKYKILLLVRHSHI